jgi:hypothetical protein
MRRLFLSVVSLGLLGMTLGCGHMHGVCDCDQTGPCGTYGSCPCYGHGELRDQAGYPPVGAALTAPLHSKPLPAGPTAAPALAPEPAPAPTPAPAPMGEPPVADAPAKPKL